MDYYILKVVLCLGTYANSSFVVQDPLGTDLVTYLDTGWTLQNESENMSIVKPSIGFIKIHDCCDPVNITIVYNDTNIHSLPIIVNIIDNALYRLVSVLHNKYFKSLDIFLRKSYSLMEKSVQTSMKYEGCLKSKFPYSFSQRFVNQST